MRLLPKSLVGRNALFLTVILILNNFLWFELVRPAVYERYVQPYQIYHPKGILRFLVDVEWALFALIVCTVGVYIIFYWLRRQLQSLIGAARILGDGRMPPPLPETGPEEIRELSRGFNQLALNLEALESDRRLMLVGISHDLSTPLTRLRLAIELMEMKPDVNQVPGMIQDIEEMNGILVQFADYAKTGKDEEPVPGDFNQVVAEVCQRYIAVGKAVHSDLAKDSDIQFSCACRPPLSHQSGRQRGSLRRRRHRGVHELPRRHRDIECARSGAWYPIDGSE